MRYHHIVFDVDGTLLDTEEAILQSFQKTLREHAGIEKELSELSFCLGITGAAALKRLETGHEEEILLQWKENLAALRDFVRVFDGIELLLKRLRADGFQLGVVTSRCRAEYERDFMRLGLDGYFDTVVCEDDTVRHKPDPEPMLEYMERTGVCPQQILYIGDSIYDMQCASRAGVDSCLALWGCHCPDGISSTHRFEEPAAMIRWLE